MVSKVYVQSSRAILAVALGWGVVSATSVGGAPLAKVGPGSLLATFAETNPVAGGRAGEGSAKAVADRLAEVRANLGALMAEGAGLTNAPQGISPQELSLRRAMYQRLVGLYEQQLRATAELEGLKNRKAELIREAHLDGVHRAAALFDTIGGRPAGRTASGAAEGQERGIGPFGVGPAY